MDAERNLISGGSPHPGNVVEFDLACIGAHFFDLICEGWIAVASNRSKNDQGKGEFKPANDAIKHGLDYTRTGTT